MVGALHMFQPNLDFRTVINYPEVNLVVKHPRKVPWAHN